ncbi:MAG: hypothetical protein ACW99A_17710, partial [Candidatus Kariarchaeaceae archaeon]
MKLSLVVAIVFLFLFFNSLDSTTALLGGNVETQTSLIIPTDLTGGESVTISSTTTFVGGPVFLGETTFYYLPELEVVGSHDYGTSLSITNPTMEFSISNSMTLRVIKIPINSISVDSVLSWFLTLPDGLVLADGEIGVNELTYMQQHGEIMIVIGSIQSDDILNDNKYASGISLTAGSYRINMSQPTILDYSVKASNTYQGVYAFEDGVIQNTYPQLQLLGGTHRERKTIINGVASSSIIVNQGASYVLAYYGDIS